MGRGPGVSLSPVPPILHRPFICQFLHCGVEVLSAQLEGTEDFSAELPCRVWNGGTVRDEDREMGPNSVGPCRCGDEGQWEPLKI